MQGQRLSNPSFSFSFYKPLCGSFSHSSCVHVESFPHIWHEQDDLTPRSPFKSKWPVARSSQCSLYVCTTTFSKDWHYIGKQCTTRTTPNMQPNHVLTGITNHRVGTSSVCSRAQFIDPFPQIDHGINAILHLISHSIIKEVTCKILFTVDPLADPTQPFPFCIFILDQQRAQEVATRSNIPLALP